MMKKTLVSGVVLGLTLLAGCRQVPHDSTADKMRANASLQTFVRSGKTSGEANVSAPPGPRGDCLPLPPDALLSSVVSEPLTADRGESVLSLASHKKAGPTLGRADEPLSPPVHEASVVRVSAGSMPELTPPPCAILDTKPQVVRTPSAARSAELPRMPLLPPAIQPQAEILQVGAVGEPPQPMPQAASKDPLPLADAFVKPRPAVPNAAVVEAPVAPLAENGPPAGFGHAEDYSWLSGELQFIQARNVWRLRYAPFEQEGRYGGTVLLVGDGLPTNCQAGQIVRVEGQLVNPETDEARPPYWVRSFKVLKVAPATEE